MSATLDRLPDCPYSSFQKDGYLCPLPRLFTYTIEYSITFPIPHTHGRETDTFLLIVSVYVWWPDGASFVQIPLPGFTPTSLSWNPNGDSFVLGDKGTFCVAFLGDAP